MAVAIDPAGSCNAVASGIPGMTNAFRIVFPALAINAFTFDWITNVAITGISELP